MSKSTRSPKSPVAAKQRQAAFRQILAHTRAPGFRPYLERLLLELCRIDTTARPDVAQMARAEEACFRLLEQELTPLQFADSTPELRREPINPEIQKSPHFSLLHFTKTPAQPQGLTPEKVYEGRSNLLYAVRRCGSKPGKSVALNAHLDVVAPFISPRAKGGIVYGRGACDDKGPVVSIVAALKVLSAVLEKTGLRLNRNVLAMFVVEEETGGNGSLSLAMDRKLKGLYDSVVVCECTELKLHPANRGAVWYRAELKTASGISALELASSVVLELESEGAAIRAESRHPLFPQRPVQTCHGMLGPFGEHPSRICGEVAFEVAFDRKPARQVRELIEDCLQAGLSGYVGVYGDKTKVTDPGTGQPMVQKHYLLRPASSGFEVRVYGAAGHMGSVKERDGAITKMAHLVRSLALSRQRIEAVGGAKFRLEIAPRSKAPRTPLSDTVILEGGQGFVPTHSIEEIMERLRRAAQRGAENVLRQMGTNPEELVRVTFEKLHNVAFDGEPDSASMRNAVTAAEACGIWKDEPVLGWTVSCDARLFASEYPGMDVLTFGPGKLGFAHSDHEQIALEEIRKAVEFLCGFLLLQTGTIG